MAAFFVPAPVARRGRPVRLCGLGVRPGLARGYSSGGSGLSSSKATFLFLNLFLSQTVVITAVTLFAERRLNQP